jgi:hypothetical protein
VPTVAIDPTPTHSTLSLPMGGIVLSNRLGVDEAELEPIVLLPLVELPSTT